MQRQALAGMLWSKQFYYYDVRYVGFGRPRQSTSGGRPAITLVILDWGHPTQRRRHLHARQVGIPPGTRHGISAFHCIPLALIDPDFAKEQLVLMLREVVHAPQRPDPGV